MNKEKTIMNKKKSIPKWLQYLAKKKEPDQERNILALFLASYDNDYDYDDDSNDNNWPFSLFFKKKKFVFVF